MNRYGHGLVVFFCIQILFFSIFFTEAMSNENQLSVNERSELLSETQKFDIESFNAPLPTKIVLEKPSVLYRYGIPLVLICNAAAMGALGYGLAKVSQTANQYAPQVQEAVSDGKKVVNIANLIEIVLRQCPQGKNYLAQELSEAIPAFLSMCNCSGITKK